MKEYQLAMHLIDVRGKNEEGAEKLLALIDRPDVIAYPGQAPWLLTHAARALTMAGEAEDAQILMPGIRNGSRGTAFEGAIRAQLSQFGPQQYGINQAFLKFVLSHWKEEGNTQWSEQIPEWVSLKREYGRALIPYLQYIIEDVNQEYGVQKRSSHIRDLVEMLDAGSRRWLLDYLFKQDEIERAILMRGLHAGHSRHRRSFFDQKAQIEMANLVLELDSQADPSNPNERLELFLDYLWWGRPLHEVRDAKEWRDIADQAGALAAALPPGIQTLSKLEVIGGMYLKNPNRYEGILVASANGTSGEIQRWFVVDPRYSLRLLRKWAIEGNDSDRIRYTCMHPYLVRGPLNDNRIQHLEMERWRRTFVDIGTRPYYVWGVLEWDNVQPETIATLESLKSSSHPLVRFQAASSLLAYRETEKAFAFLGNLGPDPTWARHLLETGSGPSSEEALKMLLPFAQEGPIQQEAQDYILRHVSPWFSMDWWRALDIPWSKHDATQLLGQLRKDRDLESIRWVIENPHHDEDVTRIAFQAYAYLDPLAAITLIGTSDIYPKGLVRMIGIREWSAARKASGNNNFYRHHKDLLVPHLKPLGSSLKQNFLLEFMRTEPSLAIEIMPYIDYSSIDLQNVISTRDFQLGLAQVSDGNTRIQFLDFLLERVESFPGSTMEIALGLCVNEGIPDKKAFQVAWDFTGSSEITRRVAIEFLSPYPSLRELIAEEIPTLLANAGFSETICREYTAVGAVEEILPVLLDLVAADPQHHAIDSWLRAIGEVDTPETVSTLLGFVEDQRKSVRNTAAWALDQIAARRSSKAKWAAWGEDQEETTVLLALLKDLEDPDLEVQLGAVKALGLLGDPEALPVLVDLLREDSPIKQAAQQALDRMATTKKD